jgi:hypothetical protein
MKIQFTAKDAINGESREVELKTDSHGFTVFVGGVEVILDFSEGRLNIYVQPKEEDVTEEKLTSSNYLKAKYS